MAATHGARVFAYSLDNGGFTDNPFNEAFHTCGQYIFYYRVGSHHQNTIVGRRIKEFTLGSRTLILHAAILWPEYVSTMMWPFSFKAV